MLTFKQRVIKFEYKLNETDEEIIDWINKNSKVISKITITKLSAKTNVSPNTISRLCNKLDYRGFSDFKFEFQKDMEKKTSFSKLQPYEINLNLIDVERERKAVNLMSKANKIVFFAVGETAFVAHNFSYMFHAVDQKSEFITYENQAFRELQNNKNILLFCISKSGETKQIHTAAKIAKQIHQKIIALTRLKVNDLQKYADISLYSYAEPFYWHGYNLTDKLPLYIILNSLFQKYFEKHNF